MENINDETLELIGRNHSSEEILKAYKFTAERFSEEDGSVTLSLCEIDIIENRR